MSPGADPKRGKMDTGTDEVTATFNNVIKNMEKIANEEKEDLLDVAFPESAPTIDMSNLVNIVSRKSDSSPVGFEAILTVRNVLVSLRNEMSRRSPSTFRSAKNLILAYCYVCLPKKQREELINTVQAIPI